MRGDQKTCPGGWGRVWGLSRPAPQHHLGVFKADTQIQHPRGPRESHLVTWAGPSAAGPQWRRTHWGLASQSLGSSSPHILLGLGWGGLQYLEGLCSALSCCTPGPRDTAVRGWGPAGATRAGCLGPEATLPPRGLTSGPPSGLRRHSWQQSPCTSSSLGVHVQVQARPPLLIPGGHPEPSSPPQDLGNPWLHLKSLSSAPSPCS